MLKNMRITAEHRNMECKITWLSEKNCNIQMFTLKLRTRDGMPVKITVYDIFVKQCGIELTYSQHMPCLDVGEPKRPTYDPIELCSLVSPEKYIKALSFQQRASCLVDKSRQKPQDRTWRVTDALQNYRYDEDPAVLAECGIFVEKQLIQMEGRILETPKLKVANNEDHTPSMGRWNFNNKTRFNPTHIESWVIVSCSASCNTNYILRELTNCGRKNGILIQHPFTVIEEESQSRRQSPVIRVEKMVKRIQTKLPDFFILCVLPERKNSDIYVPWKKKNLYDFGIVTHCISPAKINDQFITNVLLKINSKLGGINSLLALEHFSHVPLIKDTPTMILGMDVSHWSPGQSDIASVAVVVGYRSWTLISRYRETVRTQCPNVEMIEPLNKPPANGNDDGIIREQLVVFYKTGTGHKPTHIIVFRDVVSESLFNQVLSIELDQSVKADQHLGEANIPKFAMIVAQKNHHTKLFQINFPDNVPPGTVDTKFVHPRNYDIYMCAQAGMIGTSRPSHYHVLVDDIGFSPDDLRNLIHSLSYVYQRGTTAISNVASICYAHLGAAQMGQFVKFRKGSVTSSDSIPVQHIPRLHGKGYSKSRYSKRYASWFTLCFLVWIASSLFSSTVEAGPFKLRIDCGSSQNSIIGQPDVLWEHDMDYTGGRAERISMPGIESRLHDNTVRIFDESPEDCYVLHLPEGRYTFRVHMGVSLERESLFDISLHGTLISSLKSGWSRISDTTYIEGQLLLHNRELKHNKEFCYICFHNIGNGYPTIKDIEALQIKREAYTSSGEVILKTVASSHMHIISY